MKRISSLIAVLIAMVSCVTDPLPVASIPSVTLGENGKGYRDNGTGEEGELMRTSVRLFGLIDEKKVSIHSERGFYVGENIEEVQNGSASRFFASTNEESFSQDITDLKIDHTYYFCAFLKDGNKIAKSAINSFHTKAEGFALVNELSCNGNTISARVADDGGCKITHVGFCFSHYDDPNIFDLKVDAEMNSDGTFFTSLPTLEPASVYHIRAFADNGASGNRISYSDDLSIITETSILEVAQNIFLLDSDGGEFVLSVSHNYPIEISIDVDWIHKIATKSANLEDIRFQIQQNVDTKERVGHISLSNQGSNDEQVITITQKAGAFIIDFPDANFKAYCVENFDQNGDGEVSNVEALVVEEIDVRTEHIESLRGIEHFKNLQYLKCSPSYKGWTTFSSGEDYSLHDENDNPVSGSLSELDLSLNAKLQHLDCSGNNITTLDLSNNKMLSWIDIKYNKELSSLFLPDNQNITSLSYGATKVGNIDLSRFPELRYLECFYSGTTNLDISNNQQIEDLQCSGNDIHTINLENNCNIQHLYCVGCGLSFLDVSHLTLLTSLSCGSNNLTILDVSNLSDLNTLWCAENQIYNLDVSHLTSLISLICNNNQITSLDVSQSILLKTLRCFNNPFLIEIWLYQGQTIDNFSYDSNISTIYYK